MLFPDAFSSGQYNVSWTTGGDDVLDLLAEARFELERLERMQRSDGAVYHKVAGAA